jgi:hypothetical protein
MRVDCRNYESRSLAGGDSVRRCRLDLAPEAPWRCPADCPSFNPRPLDLAWEEGRATEPVSDEPELDAAALGVLAEVESLLSEAGATVRAEEEAAAAKRAAKAAKRRPWKKRR